MRKFEVRICKCGKVHFFPWKDIEDAINSDKELIFICKHCGAAVRYGGTDYFDGVALYQEELKPGIITAEDLSTKYSKIIYSEGVKVPMMTGQFADFYSGDVFYDCQPHFWSSKIYSCENIEELRKYYEQQNDLAKKVNKKRFYKQLTPEQVEALDSYYIPALNSEKFN